MYSDDTKNGKDLLHDYLQTQLNSVTSTNSDNKSCLSYAVTPSYITKKAEQAVEW